MDELYVWTKIYTILYEISSYIQNEVKKMKRLPKPHSTSSTTQFFMLELNLKQSYTSFLINCNTTHTSMFSNMFNGIFLEIKQLLWTKCTFFLVKLSLVQPLSIGFSNFCWYNLCIFFEREFFQVVELCWIWKFSSDIYNSLVKCGLNIN